MSSTIDGNVTALAFDTFGWAGLMVARHGKPHGSVAGASTDGDRYSTIRRVQARETKLSLCREIGDPNGGEASRSCAAIQNGLHFGAFREWLQELNGTKLPALLFSWRLCRPLHLPGRIYSLPRLIHTGGRRILSGKLSGKLVKMGIGCHKVFKLRPA